MYIGVSLNKGYHFGVPIIKIIVFWDLFGAPYFWETTIYWRDLSLQANARSYLPAAQGCEDGSEYLGRVVGFGFRVVGYPKTRANTAAPNVTAIGNIVCSRTHDG